MGQLVIYPTMHGSTPPYLSGMRNNPASGPTSSYSSITSSEGTQFYTIKFNRLETKNGKYDECCYVEMVLDLREYSLANFVSASLTFHNTVGKLENFWHHEVHDSIVLSGQRESTRSSVNKSLQDYNDMYHGGFGGPNYSNRMPVWAFRDWSTVTLMFSAEGINYLNTVATKPYFKGYAIFSLLYGGQVSNLTPDNDPNGDQNCDQYVFYDTPTVILNYTSKVQIKSGGVWKDALGAQIKSGGAWKAVTDFNIKSGGVWKGV